MDIFLQFFSWAVYKNWCEPHPIIWTVGTGRSDTGCMDDKILGSVSTLPITYKVNIFKIYVAAHPNLSSFHLGLASQIVKAWVEIFLLEIFI